MAIVDPFKTPSLASQDIVDPFAAPKEGPGIVDPFAASTPTQPAAPKTFMEKLEQTWPVQFAKDIYHGVTLPGQVASGNLNVQPSTPGMWSDEDEAKLQATNAEIANRTRSLAAIGTPISAATRAGEGIMGAAISPKPYIPPEAPFGITLSGGERANDLAMRQAEQAAIRGGDPHAVQWAQQRQAQIQEANKNLVRKLDSLGQTIASTPTEAGEYVSEGVKSAAKIAKAAVKSAYQKAEDLGGEIHASAFENMGQGIKNNIYPNVVINDKTTPIANQMVDYLDSIFPNLAKLNKADPYGAVNPENIVGINLKGVDEIRKILSRWRGDAFKPVADADTRASQAVLDAFDEHIDQAVNGGLFNGDKSAVSAWNNARAANTDYRSTFTARKNDPVGRVIQKIIGDKTNDPLTPTKVFDQIVGSSKVNPSSLNIGVAKRLKSILGETSPEWVAAKQGVAQGLIQVGEGESTLGTGQVAQRLAKFLNGDMAKVIYSPQEQSMLRSYANLMRDITMPPGTYFPSAPGISKIMSTVSNRIGAVIGGLIGKTLVPGMPLVGELGGLTIGSQTEKAIERAHRSVTKQLPIISQQMQQWARAQEKAAQGHPLARRVAFNASANLQKSLSQLGIDLRSVLQSPSIAPAQDTQQQQHIPRPPSQQQNDNQINQPKAFAQGGAVKFSHQSVHYRKKSGITNKHCSLCTMYRQDGHCTEVVDPINPGGICKLFRRVS